MEFLKSIFGEKALTYEELENLLKENKDINLVNAANGEYVKKELMEAKTAELDAIKNQLKEANTTIQSYKDMDIESIKASADQWKNKYETETQELKNNLAKQAYEFAAKEYLGGFEFLNSRVKDSVVKEFLEKGFKLEDNKFLGADDWIKNLKETEPEVFKSSVEEKGPQFTKTMSKQPGGKKLSLSEMMEAKNKNPEMDINI